MGNTSQSGSGVESSSKNVDVNSQQSVQIYEQILRSLSLLCTDDQFPLNVFRQGLDASSQQQIMEMISSPRRSDDFSSLLIKLIWNNRSSIPRDDVTTLFRDCCAFDLKQALTLDAKTFQTTMLENDCFSALTNSIGTSATPGLEPNQFNQWLRTQFPTLFQGFEMWFRKNSTLPTDVNQSSSNHSLMPMNNVLNPTWIWLLTHHLPILYLSSDDSCSNPLERMASVLYGRMWDHLYDSHRDGLSLNRFQHHLFGYRSPTVILFEVTDGYSFCLCCDEEFRESPKHFGGVQACLLQVKPVFKVVLEGPKIIFMNTKSRGISAFGLFIGRDLTHTFLNIDGDFFNVKHLHGEGRLAAIDIWGVGGKKGADDQSSLRQWENKQIEKNRKVKLDYEGEEAILNMAGIETRHRQEQF